MMPPRHRIGLVRSDAGFCVTAFLAALEVWNLLSIIVARLTRLVCKLVLHWIPETEWRPVVRGIAVADMMAALPVWQGQRRLGCLRQTLTEPPEARGRRLIECPGSTDHLFVTTVPYAEELVTRMYAGRAESENRIKELKEGPSLDTFRLQSFGATDAAFRTGCVLYSLLMGVRETVLPACWFERRLRVRFAVPTEERAEFLQRLRTLSEGCSLWRSWTGSSARPTRPRNHHRSGRTPSYGFSNSRRTPLAPCSDRQSATS